MSSKHLLCVVFLFLLAPALSFAAEDNTEDDQHCGLSNLGACLPEKLYEYTLVIINAPLQPFLTLIRSLLAEPVNVDGFVWLWALIVYVLSLFYGLFVLFAGFMFIVSSYSDERREQAKEWLKNVVLLVFFVQASFFIYELLIDISASLTAGILSLIDPNFFLLTIDNIPNLSLQLTLVAPYLFVLFLTVIFFVLRYLLVAAGVVLFPIALFFHFIPLLKSYGSLMINVLLIVIFLPFFQGIILLFGSLLLSVPVFQNIKIIITTVAFLLVVLVFVLLIVFAVVKAAFGVMNSDMGRAAKVVYAKMPAPQQADAAQTDLRGFV